MSWDELWQAVQITAAYFSQELGSRQQQIVSVLLPNSIDFIVTYLAILHSGHITMPLDPAFKPLELDAIIRQIDPKLLITDARYGDQLDASQTRIIHIDQLNDTASPKQKPLRLPAKEQVASLTFTSGTTGTPKAATEPGAAAPSPEATPTPPAAPLAPEQILAAGPRNPVGVYWIDLAKADSTAPLPYGLHGTAIPNRMKTQESLGGLRLTNWDIARAVRMLPEGTPLAWK